MARNVSYFLITALTAAPQQIELGSIFSRAVRTYVTLRYVTLRIETYVSTLR